MDRDCLPAIMWFPLEANVVDFLLLKAVLFWVVAA
jgi:hypothetical protein